MTATLNISAWRKFGSIYRRFRLNKLRTQLTENIASVILYGYLVE